MFVLVRWAARRWQGRCRELKEADTIGGGKLGAGATKLQQKLPRCDAILARQGREDMSLLFRQLNARHAVVFQVLIKAVWILLFVIRQASRPQLLWQTHNCWRELDTQALRWQERRPKIRGLNES